jgi:hypothetical protein
MVEALSLFCYHWPSVENRKCTIGSITSATKLTLLAIKEEMCARDISQLFVFYLWVSFIGSVLVTFASVPIC